MKIEIDLSNIITTDGWNKEIQNIISDTNVREVIHIVGPSRTGDITSDHALSFIKAMLQAFCHHSLEFKEIILERVDLAWCDELFAFLANRGHNTTSSCGKMQFNFCTQNRNLNSLAGLMQSQSITELVVRGTGVLPAEVVEHLTNLETFLLVGHRLDSLAKVFRENKGPRLLKLSMFGAHMQHDDWMDLANSLVGNEKVEGLYIFKGVWNQEILHAFINSIGTMPNLTRCTLLPYLPRLSEADDASVLEQVRNFRNHRLKKLNVHSGFRFHDALRTTRMIRYELIRNWAGGILRGTTDVSEGLWANILEQIMSKYEDPLDRVFYFLRQKPELIR